MAGTFKCYYFTVKNNGEHIKNDNTSCWAGFKKSPKNKPIYITNYMYDQRLETDRKRIVFLINKITPCSFEEMDGKLTIKYQPIADHRYFNNLVLLNFLRMIWYNPGKLNIRGFFTDVKKRYGRKDPLKFMMECVKNNITYEDDYGGFLNHSLVTDQIVPRTKAELMAYRGNNMGRFLKNEE